MSARIVARCGASRDAGRREVDHGASPVLPEDVQVDVAHERLPATGRGAAGARALNRRGPSHQGADLGVAELGLRRHLGEQGVLRVADELVVDVARAPLVAVREQPRRLPGREHVELRVPVQVDQPGEDHAAGLEHPHSRGSGLLHRRHRPAVDDHVPVVPRGVGGDHGPPQGERRRRGGCRPRAVVPVPGATTRGRRGDRLVDALGVRPVEEVGHRPPFRAAVRPWPCPARRGEHDADGACAVPPARRGPR